MRASTFCVKYKNTDSLSKKKTLQIMFTTLQLVHNIYSSIFENLFYRNLLVCVKARSTEFLVEIERVSILAKTHIEPTYLEKAYIS